MRLPLISALLLAFPLGLMACKDKGGDDSGLTDGGGSDGGGTADGGGGDGGGTDGGGTDGGGADGGGTDGGGADGGGADGGGADGGGADGGADGGGADGGGADGGGSDGGGGDGGSGDWTAREGRWIYDSVTVVKTSCEAATEFLPIGEGDFFFVTASDGTQFDKEIAALAESTTCVQTGPLFTCDPIEGDVALKDYDVVLPTTIEIEGELWTTLQADGKYAVTIDCIGSNCAVAEALYSFSFPCTFDLDWVAAHESL